MRFPLALTALVCVLAGCSSEEDDASVAGPPPSEPLVFEASSDTKNELGIERWGFAIDSANHGSRYRAYGARNEVLATVVQKNDISGADTQTFTMKLEGPRGDASENIELSVKAGENGEKELYVLVTENTFEEGKFPARVLARFKEDSHASTSVTTANSGLLTGKSRPLVSIGRIVEPTPEEGGDPLVTHCNESIQKCLVPLIDARNDASDASGSCGLLSRVGMPVLACLGAAVLTIETGPAAALACGGAGFTTSATQEILCATSRMGAVDSAKAFVDCDKAACAAASQ